MCSAINSYDGSSRRRISASVVVAVGSSNNGSCSSSSSNRRSSIVVVVGGAAAAAASSSSSSRNSGGSRNSNFNLVLVSVVFVLSLKAFSLADEAASHELHRHIYLGGFLLCFAWVGDLARICGKHEGRLLSGYHRYDRHHPRVEGKDS